MKFVTFEQGGQAKPGLVIQGERVLDLAAALGKTAIGPVRDLVDIIKGGAAPLEAVREAERQVGKRDDRASTVALSEVRLLAPIPFPRKNIFCVGRNYKAHVAEAAAARGKEMKLPDFVQFFTKPPLAVIGPYDDIPWDPDVTQKLDYEVELGIVIGRAGRNIPRERAMDYVFGYTVINDVTARDLQKQHDQWFKGKGLDGSCPMGPWIVDRDSIPNPQDVVVRLRVNGEVRQEASTAMMIFDLPEIIAQLSQGLTLEAGDVIATGTPSGVGFAMDPPRFLGDGDIVETEVVGVGILRNKVRRIEHVVAS